MNGKAAKKIRKQCNEIIPLSNIVGKNIYRQVKKSYTNKERLKTLEEYMDRYEDLFTRQEINKAKKYYSVM